MEVNKSCHCFAKTGCWEIAGPQQDARRMLTVSPVVERQQTRTECTLPDSSCTDLLQGCPSLLIKLIKLGSIHEDMIMR